MDTNTKAAPKTSEMSEVKSNMGEASCKIKEGVGEIVGEAKNVVHMGQEYAKHTFDEGIETINEKSHELKHALEKTVKAKPLQSIGIAVGLGFLVGGLFRSYGRS